MNTSINNDSPDNTNRINDTSPLEPEQSLWKLCIIPPKNGKLWDWLKWRLLPVEIVGFLFLFGVHFQMQISQQYVLQKYARTAIDNWMNGSDHMCLKQKVVENLTSPETYIQVQSRVNSINMISNLAYLPPSIVVSLILGSLSDYYGRKPVIIAVFVGQALSGIVIAFIVYLDLSVWLFVVVSFISGLSGGFGTSMFAYVTDIVPERWLTLRMGMIEVFIFLGSGVGSLSVDTWIEASRCSFSPQVWLLIATSSLGLLFACIIPESLSKKAKLTNMAKSSKGIGSLVKGFKIYFKPSYLGNIKLWQLWVITLVMCLATVNEAGHMEIMGYFLYNKPLLWHYDRVGQYMLVSSMSQLAALLVLLPILVVFKVPDSIIVLIGCVFCCASCVYTALLTRTWEMFLGKETPHGEPYHVYTTCIGGYIYSVYVLYNKVLGLLE